MDSNKVCRKIHSTTCSCLICCVPENGQRSTTETVILHLEESTLLRWLKNANEYWKNSQWFCESMLQLKFLVIFMANTKI